MTFVPLPNTAEVDMIYTSGGQNVENRFYFEAPAPWDVAGLGTLATAMSTWESGTAKPMRNTGTELILIRAVDASTQNGPGVEVGQAIVGTNAGASTPNNVTICVKLGTGLTGRSFRGRHYWLGMSVSMIDPSLSGNTITSAAQIAIVAALAKFLPGGGAGLPSGTQWVVASKFANKAPRATGVVTPIINVGLSDTYFDSQRRRLPGHNRHR